LKAIGLRRLSAILTAGALAFAAGCSDPAPPNDGWKPVTAPLRVAAFTIQPPDGSSWEYRGLARIWVRPTGGSVWVEVYDATSEEPGSIEAEVRADHDYYRSGEYEDVTWVTTLPAEDAARPLAGIKRTTDVVEACTYTYKPYIGANFHGLGAHVNRDPDGNGVVDAAIGLRADFGGNRDRRPFEAFLYDVLAGIQPA
jgi:hypothetical protein